MITYVGPMYGGMGAWHWYLRTPMHPYAHRHGRRATGMGLMPEGIEARRLVCRDIGLVLDVGTL